ncbi:DUF975 family protein [Bombilactobacillus apium]|uniref:DUF975 family protein n=1 Tax=Bombilactobacillus apium TaxID=2675299 RepID=UPI0015A2B1C0|nr:DUF975 family protein [Bombilactobacillus apium]
MSQVVGDDSSLANSANFDQIYAQVLRAVTNNPQFNLNVAQFSLAYLLVTTGVSFAVLSWLRRSRLERPLQASLQVFSGLFFWRVLFLALVYLAIEQIGFALIYIVVFYFTYSFRLTFFVLYDASAKGKLAWRQIFKPLMQSWQLMRGQRWQLFCLDISFLGWELLNFFTLGLLTIFIAPYRVLTYALFYENTVTRGKD